MQFKRLFYFRDFNECNRKIPKTKEKLVKLIENKENNKLYNHLKLYHNEKKM